MLPFYYPTTIAVVDDDPLFLESFLLRFSDLSLLQAFSDPAAMVRTLIEQYDSKSVDHPAPIMRHQADSPGNDTGGSTSNLLIPFVSCSRFKDVSVAIIDYDMPAMNGLQVCRALNNLPIRKILLTGKAGAETGIAALNEGLIDGYFVKQDRNLTRQLRAGIERHRSTFFSHLARSLDATLSRDELGFLENTDFGHVIDQLYADGKAVEHYVALDPPGVVAFSFDGQATCVFAANDASANSQVQVARDNNAPLELITMLERRRVIAAFPEGFYTEDIRNSWRQYLVAARALPGGQWSYGFGTALALTEKWSRGACLASHLSAGK